MGKPILLLLLGLEFVAWLVAMAGTGAWAGGDLSAKTAQEGRPAWMLLRAPSPRYPAPALPAPPAANLDVWSAERQAGTPLLAAPSCGARRQRRSGLALLSLPGGPTLPACTLW